MTFFFALQEGKLMFLEIDDQMYVQTVANMKNMLDGKQDMSVFKDTRTLAAQVVTMVDQICTGQIVDVKDTESFDNGSIVVPTYLCYPVVVDINNYYEILIDSGYYTEYDLGL